LKRLFQNADNILLLSIKPRYTDMIFAGSKRTELRRVKPRVGKGDIVVVYETSPTMALVGYAVVESVITENPQVLWDKVEGTSGIEKREFNLYFKGAELAYGINISKAIKLDSSVPLVELKSLLNGFHPPQSYMYLNVQSALKLCDRANNSFYYTGT